MNNLILPAETIEKLKSSLPMLEQQPPSALDFTVLEALFNSDNFALAGLFHRRRFESGEVIYQENARGELVGILWAGQVMILKDWPDEPVVLGYRYQGDIIGEMALLEGGTRSATVIALAPTELLETDRRGFNELLNRPPFVGLNLLEMLSARLRAADDMRTRSAQAQRELATQVTELETQKHHLQEIDRLRQETTDLIVHDLRNPLGAVSFALKALQLLLPEDVLEANGSVLDTALSAAGRMQRLVDSMLEVSRMQAGEVLLDICPIDLVSSARQIAAGVTYMYKDRLEVVYDLPPDLPPVPLDRDKIERVLANLLDNALKHTPNQGRVTLAMRREDDQVLVSVTDTGPGIPPEERQRIFERFAQTSGEKKRRRGFGLGLAYCKLAVEAHGGRIWVEPGPGDTGSRFVFTLPAG